MNIPAEFDEIRPYEASEMRQAFDDLLNDRQFQLILKGFTPWLPKAVRNGLLRLAFTGVKTPLDFQKRFMKPVVNYIIRKHTDGLTFDDRWMDGQGNGTYTPDDQRFTFLSNHRDIVLDSAFLDVKLVEKGYPTTVEIGIGDNLLIYPWIKRLVRMNKAFTVRRGLTPHEMLRSSQLMSRYIHFAVTQKRENIWIAQREGRAKDSDDRTQESVLKMLAMGATSPLQTSPQGGGSPADRLRDLNIVPLSISYEYDPCDYLKAQEMQQKRDNPAFKKSRQDDLDNMKTGILGYKGRVHYSCARPVNTWLDTISALPKQEFYAALAAHIDRDIFMNYQPFPGNYVALDELTDTPLFADRYTDEEKATFDRYLDGQLAKVTLPHPDRDFLRHQMLLMYANPMKNHLDALKL